MSLHLDPRQRAMLREMGVRVWQPAEPVAALAEPVAAMDIAAEDLDRSGAKGHFVDEKPAAAVRSVAAAPVSAPPPAVRDAGGPAAWHLGAAQPLYPDAAPAAGARWLVLAETPASALDAPPFQGDAGRLLDNMLRAVRLHRAGSVLLAPLVRHAAAGSLAEVHAALAALVAQTRPDVLLVMGRLAAQALLATNAPFGKLRGQAHALHGAKVVVTYDATYLLRSPADKAKAWDDLCLAMRLSAPAA